MKKRITVAICVIMMLATVACGGKKPADSSGKSSASPTGTEQEVAKEPQDSNIQSDPAATILVTINTEGMGMIGYEEGETVPEIDPEKPYQSAQINLEEAKSYTFVAAPEDGNTFSKWMKNGEEFSTEPNITVLLDESADFVAVFLSSEDGTFSYIHDPRENPEAMADIIENPDAVYGFAPDPESKRLGSFAEYDWTDPEFVARAQEERRAYHESMDSMTDILYRMRDEGASIEEMARAVSEERNRLRMESYADDPEGLATMKESNLKTYGREEGPTPDQLYEKYGSWTAVMQKAFSSNMGMDACCGLYDEYYWLYIELGYVE